MPEDPAEFAPTGGVSWHHAARDALQDLHRYVVTGALPAVGPAAHVAAAKAAGEGSSSTT